MSLETRWKIPRILCIIAMENPDLEYCPTIPTIVSLCLHFLNEEETYILVHLMIKQSTQNSWYFPTSFKGHQTFLLTFSDIIRKRYKKHLQENTLEKISTSHKKIYDHIVSLGITTESFTALWFDSLFVNSLPFQVVLRIFDSYLDEGANMLYRIGLGLIKIHHLRLLKTKVKEEFMMVLNQLISNNYDQNMLLKVSCALDLPREKLLKMEKKAAKKIKKSGVSHDFQRTVYYRPKIIESSCIIPDEEFEYIWSYLPARYRIMDPLRVFYTGVDGWSLRNLIIKCEKRKPTILLVKTKDEKVFGAFVTEEWKMSPKSYFGDNSCFVFSLKPKEAKYQWEPGNPPYFVTVSTMAISIGGGKGAAIIIEADLLKGRSEPSDTFKNVSLTGSSDMFNIIAIEMYTFI